VTLLAANLAVPPPRGVEVVQTPTAADLAREAEARAAADVVLMAAAVADYAPEPVAGKRPKSDEDWQLTLHPTEDILGALGESRNGSVLVGFGAEEGEAGLERKRRMLADKHLDLVVFNDVSREDIGFDAPDNEVVLIGADGERKVGKAPKERIAAEILDEVERLLA
jgi:phosphopantothenoylcysteine decarboxylase/phosphopantothenate--cysteine ligase